MPCTPNGVMELIRRYLSGGSFYMIFPHKVTYLNLAFHYLKVLLESKIKIN